ncbi:MAG: GreA/GreB family elongation factor, partial [Candidatus Binatia bacterium]
MKEAKKKLEDEIRTLDRELKEEIPKALKTAAAMGDLSENAEYQAAKERQSFLQARLFQLRDRLATLSMVNLSKIPTDKVSYGSKVVLLDLDTDKEVTYKLVSSEESNVKEGLISTASPIGKSLMGHEEG